VDEKTEAMNDENNLPVVSLLVVMEVGFPVRSKTPKSMLFTLYLTACNEHTEIIFRCSVLRDDPRCRHSEGTILLAFHSWSTLQNSCDVLPQDPTKPLLSHWVKHHLTVWLDKGNPGKLMALLPPLVLNDPAVSCGVYSPWAAC